MGQRLLIVDSDRAFLKEHRDALDASYELELLGSTDGAIQALERGGFAAVLICVEVSENKGYALCSAIRKNPDLADIKIALISAKATQEEYARHQSLRGRADLYLHKPILPSVLVAELAPLVPAKAVDPDRPLGDLSDVDLGEEWLESLKVEVDSDLHVGDLPMKVVHEPSPAPKPAPTPQPPPVPQPPPETTFKTMAIQIPAALKAPNAGMVELLESRIQDLEQKLVARAKELESRNAELEDLRAREAAAVQSLADFSAYQTEVEALHGRIQEYEELVQAYATRGQEQEEMSNTLQARLQEAEEGLQQYEQHSSQLQSHIELLGRQREQYEAELEELRSSSATLHGSAAEVLELREALEKASRLAAQRGQELDAQGELKTACQARITELEQELRLVQQDVTGLEATLRAQRRELAEQGTLLVEQKQREERQGARLQELESQLEEVRASLAQRDQALAQAQAETLQEAESHRASLETLTAQQAEAASAHESEKLELRKALEAAEAAALEQLEESEAKWLRHDEALRASEAALAEARRELEGQQVQIMELEGLRETYAKSRQEWADLEQRLNRTLAEHQQQQHELLAGLDEKESQVARLNTTLEAQRDRIAQLESEQREVQGQLNERTARLDSLSDVLKDLEQGLRRASDMTRPF